jgi:uncharacterized repeat protein (TIGR04076 family)
MDAEEFTLYDLRVEVIATGRPMVCSHRAGDWFEVSRADGPVGDVYQLERIRGGRHTAIMRYDLQG